MRLLIFFLFLIHFLPSNAKSFPLTSKKQKFEQLIIAGGINIFSGEFEAGGEKFTRALKESKNPKVYTLILLSTALSGNNKSAVRFCSVNPGTSSLSHSFQYWCSRIMMENGYKKIAYQRLKRAIALGGDLPHYLSTAVFFSKYNGKIKESEGFLVKLLKKQPWILSSWLFPDYLSGIIFTTDEIFSGLKFKGGIYQTLAVFAWKGKHPDLAEKYVNEAIQLFKTVPEALYQLKMKIIKIKGDTNYTEQQLKAALRILPRSVPLLFLKSQFLYAKRKISDALIIMERLVKLDPYSSLILTKAGTLNLEIGKINKGYIYLKYAQARGSNSSYLDYGFGVYYQKKNQIRTALFYFKRAVRKDPANLKYLSSYIALLQAMGKKNEINSERKKLIKLKKILAEAKIIETKYKNRFSILNKIKSRVLKGESISWPLNCDVQCQFLKAYVKISTGKKISAISLVNALTKNKNILSATFPLTVWKKNSKLNNSISIGIIRFFYSSRPSYFD